MQSNPSSAGEAIDIAVTSDNHSSAFGLGSNSAFLILGNGDLSEDFSQLYISPKIFAKITTAQALRMLLQRSKDFIYLSPAVEAKIKNLEAEGWKVHKIHHDLLTFYYSLRFAKLEQTAALWK